MPNYFSPASQGGRVDRDCSHLATVLLAWLKIGMITIFIGRNKLIGALLMCLGAVIIITSTRKGADTMRLTTSIIWGHHLMELGFFVYMSLLASILTFGRLGVHDHSRGKRMASSVVHSHVVEGYGQKELYKGAGCSIAFWVFLVSGLASAGQNMAKDPLRAKYLQCVAAQVIAMLVLMSLRIDYEEWNATRSRARENWRSADLNRQTERMTLRARAMEGWFAGVRQTRYHTIDLEGAAGGGGGLLMRSPTRPIPALELFSSEELRQQYYERRRVGLPVWASPGGSDELKDGGENEEEEERGVRQRQEGEADDD